MSSFSLVLYQESQQWNPGELRDAALGQFNDLLKKAKNAANSWGNKDGVAKLDALDKRLKQKIAASKSDEWQVNAAVHYNAWAQFTKEEMLATVNAIEGLVSGFCCESCGSKLYVTYQSNLPASLACHCGQTTQTLIGKS